MRHRTVGALDPSFAWDGERLLSNESLSPSLPVPKELRGALALVSGAADHLRIVRDPLGLNKIFWALESPSSLVVAARPQRLVAAGIPFGQIKAFPRAGVLDLDGDGARYDNSRVIHAQPEGMNGGRPSLEDIGASIWSALDSYMAAIAAEYPGHRALVCCSGGLDSSGILVLATLHFRDVIAVSFDFDRSDGSPSDDRRAARQLCRDLDVPLLETDVTAERLLEYLDTVLVEGCDWRDFNVHAALVNAAVADCISQNDLGEGIVFTGDLANEFMADYHAEVYRGQTYYRLPRLAPGALRGSLVNGLDTTNREIGVFGAWGLPVVQPYAVAVDNYLQLPDELLGRDDAKQQLCRLAFGHLLPSYIFYRQKVRAQIGSSDSGTGVLAACVDRGIDQRELRARFARLHGIDDLAQIDHFTRAGRYRSATPFVEEGDW